jgi:hypothetical protein
MRRALAKSNAACFDWYSNRRPVIRWSMFARHRTLTAEQHAFTLEAVLG